MSEEYTGFCNHCGQKIETFRVYEKGQWYDRETGRKYRTYRVRHKCPGKVHFWQIAHDDFFDREKTFEGGEDIWIRDYN